MSRGEGEGVAAHVAHGEQGVMMLSVLVMINTCIRVATRQYKICTCREDPHVEIGR